MLTSRMSNNVSYSLVFNKKHAACRQRNKRIFFSDQGRSQIFMIMDINNFLHLYHFQPIKWLLNTHITKHSQNWVLFDVTFKLSKCLELNIASFQIIMISISNSVMSLEPIQQRMHWSFLCFMDTSDITLIDKTIFNNWNQTIFYIYLHFCIHECLYYTLSLY